MTARGRPRRRRARSSTANADDDDRRRARPPRLGVAGPERHEQQRGELRPARQRDGRAAGHRARQGDEPPDQECRGDRVVGVRARRVLRERPGDPRERERRCESRATEPPADDHEAEQTQAVEEDRRQMHGGQRVPLVAPAEDRVARDVRQVRDRARRCHPAGSRTRSGRSSECGRAPRRSRRPARTSAASPRPGSARTGSAPCTIRSAPMTPGVADVDHVRRPDVEADPEAGEEHRRGGEHPDRPDRCAARRPVAARDPEAAHEDPGERRVGERHRREDVTVVEEPERDRERQEDEQVDVPDREQPPPVDEPEQEERREAEPDAVAVDLRAAERAGRAARHPPGDLRPRPRLDHRRRSRRRRCRSRSRRPARTRR